MVSTWPALRPARSLDRTNPQAAAMGRITLRRATVAQNAESAHRSHGAGQL
jgi:hypothetical protein